MSRSLQNVTAIVREMKQLSSTMDEAARNSGVMLSELSDKSLRLLNSAVVRSMSRNLHGRTSSFTFHRGTLAHS